MAGSARGGSGGGTRSGSGGGSAGGTSGGTAGGTSSGSMGGTAGGSAVGRRGAGVDARQRAVPVAPAASTPYAPTPKASPALVGLAIAGWATFAVQWVVVLVIVLGRGSNLTATNAAAPTASPRHYTRPTNTASADDRRRPTSSAGTSAATPAAAGRPADATDPGNPLQMPQANVLGLPLEADHTVVLLDAIQISEDWLDDAKATLLRGLSRPANGRQVSLLISRDGQATALPDNPFTPAANQLSNLAGFLNPVTASGSGGLADSIDAAVASDATQMIFITSRATGWGSWLGTLDGKLTSGDGRVTLHIVQIGEVNQDLQNYITSSPNNGNYLHLQPAQLRQWRSDAGR